MDRNVGLKRLPGCAKPGCDRPRWRESSTHCTIHGADVPNNLKARSKRLVRNSERAAWEAAVKAVDDQIVNPKVQGIVDGIPVLWDGRPADPAAWASLSPVQQEETLQEAIRRKLAVKRDTIVNTLYGFVENEDIEPEIRMRAIDRMMDRAYGKPRVTADVNTEMITIVEIVRAAEDAGFEPTDSE